MNKTQAIEKVNGMLPSLVLFTQEQVVEIINEIKAEQTELSRDLIEKIIIEYNDAFLNVVRYQLDFEDIVDTDSAEFELYGNEIQLTSVDVSSRKVVECITDNVYLDDLIGKVQDKFCPEDSEENNESNEDNNEQDN
jgi:hypothetical protein